ncbi:unnamed protein product [Rotaria sordida]|uniref:Uncharacterized protein n=1 Tax=Rotaria sordida TaxID=392033 RepID=A0A818QS55_9BILA|nr:unnamed protein product [Rotaria sordida]CAF3898696.1 unnamed protein product [Rotaria sordida]
MLNAKEVYVEYFMFSAINRAQTIERSRLMVSILDVLMTIRMLLKDDLRRCQQVVSKAFESWSDLDYNRRFHQIQLLIDAPNDYEPVKQIRSTVKRNISSIHPEIMHKKTKKKQKLKCKTQVSDDDPTQNEAIQCRHQSEQFDWIDYDDNCSR